ncbi:MAG: HNH endonuclease [Verrucomicrobiales bacterium]|nr:HNH endonuclease [Verrucomicrobiales bacterium]
MDAALRAAVRQRAAFRCEYCQLPQEHAPFATFHVEHVIPRKHAGQTRLANLALACDRCNLHKGANLTGVDPDSGAVTPLFHPRRHRWEDHFRRDEARIEGRTAIGRTTVEVLCFNAPRRLRLRARLNASGEGQATS